jgi:tubulin--tyrosine ligase
MSIEVHLQMNCSYTNELIRNVLEEANGIFKITDSITSNENNVLYWLEYEDIDFDMLYRFSKESNKKHVLANSFCIRKGLLRKANFASFIQKYLTKVKVFFINQIFYLIFK